MACSAECRELSRPRGFEQGGFRAHLRGVTTSEGVCWAFPPRAKCDYHWVRPDSPFPPSPASPAATSSQKALGTPGKCGLHPLATDDPQEEAARGQASRVFWLEGPSGLADAFLHNLDRLMVFLQNLNFVSFCLIHREPVAGGTLEKIKGRGKGLPRRRVRPLWEGNIF